VTSPQDNGRDLDLCQFFSTVSRAHLRHSKRRVNAPDAGRGREFIERECITEAGTTARTKRVELLSDCGPAAMSRPFGR
jgi:hypothetical protein